LGSYQSFFNLDLTGTLLTPQSIQFGFDPVKALQQLFHVRPKLRPSDVITGNLFPRAIEQDRYAV
jgi:hypothetical protein